LIKTPKNAKSLHGCIWQASYHQHFDVDDGPISNHHQHHSPNQRKRNTFTDTDASKGTEENEGNEMLRPGTRIEAIDPMIIK
jgi:hypothetical protein